ncbi:MAG: diacylglycerol kinase family protein [Verrucomicrobiota bacterium]
MRTCIIFNPAAKGDKARHFLQHLGSLASEFALKETTCAGDARRLGAEAVTEGFQTIVAAGGDGTLNEVLNGIGDVPGGFQKARLGVLPLGTVNVFARELGISPRLDAALEVLKHGQELQVDLPCAEFAGKERKERRHFVQLAGAGLDARAIEQVSWSLKKKVGPFAYVAAGLKALCRPAAPITVSDGRTSLTGELVLIGNGRLYGGDFQIFPGADMRDGLLDACVFPRAGWLKLLHCGPHLVIRNQLPESAVVRLRAPMLTLTSAQTAPFEIEGELVGHLPATFSLQPRALRVIAKPS